MGWLELVIDVSSDEDGCLRGRARTLPRRIRNRALAASTGSTDVQGGGKRRLVGNAAPPHHSWTHHDFNMRALAVRESEVLYRRGTLDDGSDASVLFRNIHADRWMSQGPVSVEVGGAMCRRFVEEVFGDGVFEQLVLSDVFLMADQQDRDVVMYASATEEHRVYSPTLDTVFVCNDEQQEEYEEDDRLGAPARFASSMFPLPGTAVGPHGCCEHWEFAHVTVQSKDAVARPHPRLADVLDPSSETARAFVAAFLDSRRRLSSSTELVHMGKPVLPGLSPCDREEGRVFVDAYVPEDVENHGSGMQTMLQAMVERHGQEICAFELDGVLGLVSPAADHRKLVVIDCSGCQGAPLGAVAFDPDEEVFYAGIVGGKVTRIAAAATKLPFVTRLIDVTGSCFMELSAAWRFKGFNAVKGKPSSSACPLKTTTARKSHQTTALFSIKLTIASMLQDCGWCSAVSTFACKLGRRRPYT